MVTSIDVLTNADADGKVHLDLPTGAPHARVRVQATLEVAESPRTSEEYHAFLDRIAGSITDSTFARPPQPATPAVETLPHNLAEFRRVPGLLFEDWQA